ncbi:hypothetical protein [Rhodococcus kronopolitis]|uniref:DUF3263 domain-containing protein n=1 Tax=Rhodococcus kronopolitis TaxID=1460226 RepID=A0ABV9FY93_9NOCA
MHTAQHSARPRTPMRAVRADDAPNAGAGDGKDAERIRGWRRLCRYLELNGAVSPYSGWVIGFAITWAPFGGANPAQLLETFGVTPARYRQLLKEALDPRGATDSVAEVKNQLAASLLRAWAGAGAPRPAVRRAA